MTRHRLVLLLIKGLMPWLPLAKCPLRILVKNDDFRTCLSLVNPCESSFAHPCASLRILAKPWIAKACESLRNTAKQYLRICTKACESMLIHICDSLLKFSISAKTYLQKLAKTRFAKACKRCIYCQPHPCSGPSLVILNIFTLFVIMILNPIVSANFLSLSASTASLSKICQPTYKEIQLHSWFKSTRSCAIYLP